MFNSNILAFPLLGVKSNMSDPEDNTTHCYRKSAKGELQELSRQLQQKADYR